MVFSPSWAMNTSGSIYKRSVVVKGRIAHSHIIDVDEDVITYRTGVEFIELSERVAAAIAHFVDELAKHKSEI